MNVKAVFLYVLLLSFPTLAVDRDEAIASIEIHPDFQIELVAAEPTVFDPVSVIFDERGRAFVMEMPGYPFSEVQGRVILIEDADGDGFYESRKIFAEGFPVGTSVLAYDGGLLVASPPDLMFLKDMDGDNVADVREVLLTGFALDNTQHNFNGLSHGLDNWIYGANGGNGGSMFWPENQDEKTPLRNNDFRVDLRRRQVERIGRSTGGYEIAMDDWGRFFGTHNLYPISHLVFPGRYIEGLPVPREGSLTAIPDDEENGLVRIYPIGPQDTRVNHPEQSGYFSGSCGITYYGGGAFPDGFNGNMFICDVVLNLVHRRVLVPDGTTFSAKRGRDKVEFLASSDRGFRPVNMTVAPDGSLWLLDMHREVIEHPEWIPDELEENMDIEAGKEAGRIYRITPRGGLPRVTPNFDQENLVDVVAALEHPNKWWRDTAQRLLVEWNDREAVPILKGVIENSSSELGRLHAMWALEGLGELSDESLIELLNDSAAGVRENALKIADSRTHDSGNVRTGVVARAEDSDVRVRLMAALVLGQVADGNDSEIGAAVESIANRDGDDAWTRMALLSAMVKDAKRYLMSDSDAAFLQNEELLEMLAQRLGETGSSADITGFVDDLTGSSSGNKPILLAKLRGLTDGLDRRSSDREWIGLSRSSRRLLERFSENVDLETLRETFRLSAALGLPISNSQHERLNVARRTSEDPGMPAAVRTQALQLVEFLDFPDRAELLYGFLGSANPRELQGEAIRQLGGVPERSVAERLIAMWRELGPETHTRAGDILLYKRGNHELLLTALEDGRISLGELNLHLERRRVLLWSRQEGIGERAEALFSDAGVVTRKEAIEAMRPALSLKGDALKGSQIFADLCIRCHSMGDEGGDLGPNLVEIYRKSSETLLHDILDPNAGVDAKFVSFTIERNDGEVLSGIVASETDQSVTIRDANGLRTTVARSDMVEMLSDGLSLMPEELESGLDPQAIADLLAYLQEPK